MKLAKAIDDRYEEEGRLKGIARYKDLKKRLGDGSRRWESNELTRRGGLTSRMGTKAL
jgi:hypothetical protein